MTAFGSPTIMSDVMHSLFAGTGWPRQEIEILKLAAAETLLDLPHC